MSYEAVTVFTAKSRERILSEGGTSSWRLDRNNARQCTYAVCARNAHADWTEGPEPHHTAFLIGRIEDVIPAVDEGRFLIQFSEYAPIDIPDAWHGGRNPVSYGSLEKLGIDPSKLKWAPMPKPVKPAEVATGVSESKKPIGALTMAEAKTGLAKTFGVKPEQIEITVRA